MMKKFFVLMIALLALSAGGAKAQIAALPQGAELQRKGTRLAVDGVKLDKETQALILSNIAGEDLNPQWKKYTRQRNTGLGLTIGGPVLVVGGLGMSFIYILGGIFGIAFATPIAAAGGDEQVQETADNISAQIDPYINTGLIIAGVGAVSTVTGIVLLSTGCHKLNKTVKYINGQGVSGGEVSFNLGAAPSGVGLTMTF